MKSLLALIFSPLVGCPLGTRGRRMKGKEAFVWFDVKETDDRGVD